MSEWSPHANEAYEHIESAHGWGLMPDNDAISSELNHLSGKDLKQVMNRLQGEGKLGDIIGDLTPAQRQGLLHQSMDSGLVKRDGPAGKLSTTGAVPQPFQRMVDDFNAMGPGRTKALNYPWDSQPGLLDKAQNKVTATVADLKPGDSVSLSASSSGSMEALKESQSLGIAMRNDAGKYVLSLSATAGAGAEAETHGARAESMLTAGGKAEYTFDDAGQAAAVAYGLMKDRGMSAVGLGTPSAIELSGTAASELAAHLGVSSFSDAELAGGAKAQISARLMLDQNPPKLELRQALAIEGTYTKGLNAMQGDPSYKPGDSREYKGGQQLQVTTTFTFAREDAAALANGSVDNLAARAKDASTETKATVKLELSGDGKLSELELSAKVKQSDVMKLAKDLKHLDAAHAFKNLGDATEVEVAQKDYRLGGGHLEGSLETHGFGLGLGAALERKTLLHEKTIFEGSASKLVGR